MVYHNIIITNIGVVLVKTSLRTFEVTDFDRVIEKSPNIPFVLYFNTFQLRRNIRGATFKFTSYPLFLGVSESLKSDKKQITAKALCQI